MESDTQHIPLYHTHCDRQMTQRHPHTEREESSVISITDSALISHTAKISGACEWRECVFACVPDRVGESFKPSVNSITASPVWSFHTPAKNSDGAIIELQTLYRYMCAGLFLAGCTVNHPPDPNLNQYARSILTLNGNVAGELTLCCFSLIRFVFFSSEGGQGGAIWINKSLAVVNLLTSVQVSNNSAFQDGGFVYASVSALSLSQLTLNNNKALTGSGGCVYAIRTSDIDIDQSILQMCDASNGNGGAIFLSQDSEVTVTNSNITNNTALQGGAISVDHAMFEAQSCLINSNTAVWQGGL